MSEKPIVVREIRGRAVAVRGNDIDTDRIIPARFMKTLSFEELGRFAFHDARYDAAGKPNDHPFNDPRHEGAVILLANRNFGCGSSREHAPQALLRWGIRAVVGESFAEIFAGNCTAIGVPAVQAAPQDIERLMELVETDPAVELRLDLEARRIEAGGAGFPIEIPEARRRMFLSGSWDTTGVLLEGLEQIRAVAARLPYLTRFPYREPAD
jgi:3-isopropylmalate/(R)-2-methylmalate dehydratase small subunit